MNIEIVGMVWYRREEYDSAIAVMADRAKLSTSYHVWLNNAETGEKRLRREGKTVVRAYIDPKTFPDWCRTRGLNIDSHARNRFAAEVARKYVESGYRNDEVH